MSEFYKPEWEYEGYLLVSRPDTPNLFIYWRPEHGGRTRRLSTGTSDLAAARQHLMDFAQRRKRPTAAHPSDVALDVILDRYIRQKLVGKSAADGRWSARVLLDFARWAGIATVAEMTPAMQREYVRWRSKRASDRGRTLSNGTINKELEVLRAAFNYAKREGMIAEVPHVTLLSRPPARERFLTPDEIGRLLAQCHEPHLARFVMIALHTLQRPGAVLGLRCAHVDVLRGRIDFRDPSAAPSNKRRPIVPITATLKPVLEEALHESVSGHVIEYLGQPVASVKKSFQRACRRAGLKGVSPYTLRHTGATLLAAAGVPLWQVSGMLGHSYSRTTEIYAKHTPEYLAEAAAGLERAISLRVQRNVVNNEEVEPGNGDLTPNARQKASPNQARGLLTP